MTKYIHAVPNFSDGSKKDVIEAVVDQLRGIEGVKLVDYHPDANFNRTVIEVIGRPDPLKEALLNMAGKSYELINMEEQRGEDMRYLGGTRCRSTFLARMPSLRKEGTWTTSARVNTKA